MKYGDDFVYIDDATDAFSSNQNDFIEIEDNGFVADSIPRNDSFDSFVRDSQNQNSQQVPPQDPPVNQTIDTADTPSEPATSDIQVDDQEIIPKDNTDWSAKATEITKDLEFLGYTQDQIKGKDDFYVIQEQMDFIRNEMDSNQDLADIIGQINMPPANFLESEIRSSLGVFATDDDVANKLSTFLQEDGSLNESGQRIYNQLKANATSKANGIVNDIKARSAVYAKSNLDFYRKIEDSVVNFSYPPVSFEVDGRVIDVPVTITAAEKRKLYSFMQNGYTDTANGEGSDDRAKFLAENAFLLNRELFNKFISSVAANAYKYGESETLKQIKK